VEKLGLSPQADSELCVCGLALDKCVLLPTLPFKSNTFSAFKVLRYCENYQIVLSL